MRENKASLLCTIPLTQSLIDAAAAGNMAIDGLAFIDIKPVDDSLVKQQLAGLTDRALTVVFTSSHAAKIVIKNLDNHKPAWRIYCMAGITKKILTAYFGDAATKAKAKDALSLADQLIREKEKEVVFFCGNHRRDELPHQLSEQNIVVNEVEVYKTTATPHIVRKNYNGILFFSPSAVNSFFNVNKAADDTIFFAIGRTTANEIKKYTQNKIISSDSPAKELLVGIAVDYFQRQFTTNHRSGL